MKKDKQPKVNIGRETQKSTYQNWSWKVEVWLRNMADVIVLYFILVLVAGLLLYLAYDAVRVSHKTLDFLTKLNYTTHQMSTFIDNIRVYYMVHTEEKETSVQKLMEIGAVPDSIILEKDNTLINPYGGKIVIQSTEPLENKELNVESPTFKMSYQGLPRDVCISLATMNWGDKIKGLIAVAVGYYDSQKKLDTALDAIDKKDSEMKKMNYFIDKNGKRRSIRSRGIHDSNVAKPGDKFMPTPFTKNSAKSGCKCVRRDNCTFALHYTVFGVALEGNQER